MSRLTERILILKFVGILKAVKVREFQEFFKFIKIRILNLCCTVQDYIVSLEAG